MARTYNLVLAPPSGGGQPGAPQYVTATGKDSGATVSWYPPAVTGQSAITSYTITPYVGSTPQTPTTVAVGSLTTVSLTSTYSNGTFSDTRQSFNSPLNATSALRAAVTGLTNSTNYTFTVKATNTQGTSVESAASGTVLPLTGLVFGDEFAGPANGPIDPEWWVYDRCGYLSQNEVEWYKASHTYLDGNSHLVLKGTNDSVTGTTYPTNSNASKTQPWTSGAIQANTQAYYPGTVGNTITFETSAQICPKTIDGMWPSPWLEGTDYQEQWKVDPFQAGWDSTGKGEIDIAEWPQFEPNTEFLTNIFDGVEDSATYNPAIDLSLAQHIYRADYKPGVHCSWFFDGTLIRTNTANPLSGHMFPLWYLQIIGPPASADSPQLLYIDYWRIYDRNLG